MATGRDRTKRVLRVGLFALLGFVILVIGVFVIGDKQNMFNPTFTVYSDFTSVEGLKPGALVRINGIKVGSVSKVELKLDSVSFVRVTMIIDDDSRKFVRTTTVASVAQQGLIGDKQIELSVTSPSAPIVPNGAQLQSAAPTNYTAIFEDARTAVKNTEGITASLDTLFLRFRRGEGTLGKLLTDDEAYIGLTRVTSATERLLNQTSNQLASVTATLNRAALNVDDITNESKKLVADIGNGKGTIGALLYDRSLYDSLESLTGTLNDAAGSASFAAREFGINMRGLRSSWLGGLFRGDEQQEEQSAMMQREVEIRLEELKRQKELLDRREREMMAKEKQSQR
ncbi:MAG: MCE family protein [Bacteroidetes bacterium]|nr:MCE family protein [Bacteroidota bacterium]